MDAFYFLHHGQTDWNLRGQLMGHQDISLNDTGRKQAQEAARILIGHDISSICYSPLVRATETAKIIAQECPCNLYPFAGFSERAWGDWEGKVVPKDQLKKTEDHLPSGAENFEDFRHRVLSALQEASAFPSPFLIISHSGVFNVICQELHLPEADLAKTPLLHFSQRLGKWTMEVLAI